jgi:uncharacterized protein (TIGR00299 family) protein
MRILYFDCFAGASGDMIVGSLLDLGIHVEDLVQELNKIHLKGYSIRAKQVQKSGIRATEFKVFLEKSNSSPTLADGDFFEESDKQISGAEDNRISIDNHHHSLKEIVQLIKQSQLTNSVKKKAINIFTRLGEAEASIHSIPLDDIHFHEVGAVDAVVDVVSALICLEWLNVELIVVSPLHLGTGFVNSSHGSLPVPAPATAILLKNVPVYTTETKGELVTPTGAAVLTSVADHYGTMPEMTIDKIGYGAGQRDRDFPNTLRALLGETTSRIIQPNLIVSTSRDPYPEQHLSPPVNSGYHESPAFVLEANIDDMVPQLFSPLMDQLLESGALDVWFIPIQMKKNRPAIKLQVLASPESLDRLIEIIFRHSTTTGVRSYPVTKHMLQRDVISVDTKYGSVNVKVSRLGDEIMNISPEYEDCQEISRRFKIPVKKVYASALVAAHSHPSLVGR